MQEGRLIRVTLHPDLLFENPLRAKWTRPKPTSSTGVYTVHVDALVVLPLSHWLEKWSKVSFFFHGWSRKCMLMLTLMLTLSQFLANKNKKINWKTLYMYKCKQGAFVVSISPKWRWHSWMHHGHSAPFLPIHASCERLSQKAARRQHWHLVVSASHPFTHATKKQHIMQQSPKELPRWVAWPT